MQKQHLRDTIHTICIELNDQLAGSVGQVTLAGSALALDLLEDGVALRQPKYARLLAQCAVRLLELPPAEIHARLADVCEGEVEAIVRGSLEHKLTIPDPGNLTAWAALLALAGRGLHWASELAERFWPSDPSQQLAILSLPTAERAEAWIGRRHEAVIKGNPPQEVWRFIWRPFREVPRRPSRFYEWLPGLINRHRFNRLTLSFPGGGLSFLLTPIDVVRQYAVDVNLDSGDVHAGWLPMIEEVRFAQSPSKQTLADGLRRIAAAGEVFAPDFNSRLSISWVFGSCLTSTRSSAEVGRLAERAARGDLGDLPDWLAAESRWKERGVTVEDLLYLTDDRWPFDREIGQCGFPVAAAYHIVPPERGKVLSIDEDFLSRLDGVPRVQRALAYRLLFLLVRTDRTVSPQLVTRLVRLAEAQNQPFPFDAALLAGKKALRDEGWLDVLDEIGRTKTGYFYEDVEEIDLRALTTLLARYPDRVGLLPLIVQGLTSYPPPVAAKLEYLNLPRVKFEQYDDPNIRWAAVILELIQGGFHAERSRELAVITTMLRSQGVANLTDALTALTHRERFDEATDHYLLELRRQLSDAKWMEQSQVINALNNALRRRGSGVTEIQVWRDLALPVKLLDLMPTSRS